MKKTIAFALAMVLLTSLAACGTPAEDGAQDSTTTTTTVVENNVRGVGAKVFTFTVVGVDGKETAVQGRWTANL